MLKWSDNNWNCIYFAERSPSYLPKHVTDILYVKGLYEGTRVDLKNGFGQTVHWAYCNTNTYSIDMSGHPSGMYTLTAGDWQMKMRRR